jgi:hypothetical protein
MKQVLLTKILSDMAENGIKVSAETIYRLLLNLVLDESDCLAAKEFKLGNYNLEDISELKTVIFSKVVKSGFSALTQT